MSGICYYYYVVNYEEISRYLICLDVRAAVSLTIMQYEKFELAFHSRTLILIISFVNCERTFPIRF